MKRIINIIILGLIITQCTTKTNMEIAKNSLGEINLNTSIEKLDILFKGDSIEKIPNDSEFIREYNVFDLEGNKLLTIGPKYDRDSLIGVDFVKIYSSIYKTESGISTASTFKELSENYTIDKIEPTFNSAVVFVNELNATFALDKKDLKIGEFDMGKIRQDQIPDMARIKYMTLWFE